jgi:putative addiction module component (TIGR02574 family)
MASRSRKGKRGDAHTNVAEPPGFGSLSKAEQIRYLQALWDRISETPGELPVPASHLRLARERLADYRRDPTRARSPRDVIRRLANRDR